MAQLYFLLRLVDFRLVDRREVVLRLDALRLLLRLDALREEDLRLGTLAPERRASDSPMAIACLRLFALFPDRPLFNLPRLYSCIARPTFFFELELYFGMVAPFAVHAHKGRGAVTPRTTTPLLRDGSLTTCTPPAPRTGRM